MDFQPVERPSQAFQQSLTGAEIERVCRRAFGSDAIPVSAVELGGGMYNNVYRLTLAGRARPVVLRVAPEEGRQFRSEWRLMRNEYASLPYLAVIAALMPRVIAADWSHQVIRRDWMVQSLLDGVPAPGRLGDYPRSAWPVFFARLGGIARDVHAVRGPCFGPVNGPGYGTWSEAVLGSLEEIAADLDSIGLDSADVREVAAAAARDRVMLDEITEPRMMTGDLWTVNVMLDAEAAEPAITGVLDMDRTWWGDPAADWTIRMALAKQDERVAFWETYGERDLSPAAARSPSSVRCPLSPPDIRSPGRSGVPPCPKAPASRPGKPGTRRRPIRASTRTRSRTRSTPLGIARMDTATSRSRYRWSPRWPCSRPPTESMARL